MLGKNSQIIINTILVWVFISVFIILKLDNPTLNFLILHIIFNKYEVLIKIF